MTNILRFDADSRIGKLLLSTPLESGGGPEVGLAITIGGGLVTIPGGVIASRIVHLDAQMRPLHVSISYEDEYAAD